MSNTLVLYKSAYGATKAYAQWLGEALDCPVRDVSKVSAEELAACDTVLLGGGIYVSSIRGIKMLKKHWEILKDKRVIVFAVGLTDPENEQNAPYFQQIGEKNLIGEQRDRVRVFYLRGGMDFKKLGFMHRMMMGMMRKMLKGKPESERTDEDRALLRAFDTPADYVDRDSVDPIVAYIRGCV